MTGEGMHWRKGDSDVEALDGLRLTPGLVSLGATI